MKNTRRVLSEILAEGKRQEQLRLAGKIKEDLAHPLVSPSKKFVVIGEEFGEVAREVCEHNEGKAAPGGKKRLRTELIQLAAVCVAWAESLPNSPEVQS